MKFKTALITISIVTFFLLVTGCDSLRFAPTEAQRQNASLGVAATGAILTQGAEANSPAAQAAYKSAVNTQTYFGMPQQPLAQPDQILATAAADAAKKPTAFDATEEGLSLLAELAILFGVGGGSIAGKKALDWIALARQKNQGLQEIVEGNELFKNWLAEQQKTEELTAFKQSQAIAQTNPTVSLVAAERAVIAQKTITPTEVLSKVMEPKPAA